MAPRATKKVGSSSRALARPGDPFIAPNGEQLPPEDYQPEKERKKLKIAVNDIDPVAYRPTKRRTIKDCPAATNVLNGIGAVFLYTMLGVGDREIADTLNISVDQLGDIRRHSAYAECFNVVLSEFINSNSDLLSSRIASYSQAALETVGDLSVNGKKEEVRLRASTDILDRAGVRPKDQDMKQSVVRNELRIIVVDGEKDVSVNVNINDM